jgi:predicted pyridoxine 5'-phosphate oxidase superfamily flavin-nucleotide-binding protein
MGRVMDDDERCDWHEGELAARAFAGQGPMPALIRPFMSEQSRRFFPQLPLLFVGGLDAAGAPIATFLRGPPGFIACPDPRRIEINAQFLEGDPIAAALRVGAEAGFLGLDFRTRRRNRVNGRIASVDKRGFAVAVEQAFGNCPRYIHERETVAPKAERTNMRWERLDRLDEQAKGAIAAADMFFVASSAQSRTEGGGVDISHRGGPPGFVTFDEGGALISPDYNGNGFFNTLGNLLLQPKAGLLFPNFETGEALQLTGATVIVWEGPKVAQHKGAERLWMFHPCAAHRLTFGA